MLNGKYSVLSLLNTNFNSINKNMDSFTFDSLTTISNKYYPKLAIVSSDDGINIFDSTEIENVKKCLKKKKNSTVVEVDNSFKDNYLITNSKYTFISMNRNRLRINDNTFKRLISECCTLKGSILEELVLLKNKKTWIPYLIDSKQAKESIRVYHDDMKLIYSFKQDYIAAYNTTVNRIIFNASF